jgi:chromate reductase
MHKVAVIVGSIRKDSINKKLASALEKLGEDKFQFARIRIDDLPLFNQDNESNPTPEVQRMKAEIDAADAVLFVTPEHNRSIPAAMKNAIDWATRPHGKSSFKGKVAAVTGTSRGSIGTAVAQQQLKGIIAGHFLATLGSPEVYVVFTEGLIDEAGNIAKDDTRKFLQGFLDRFEELIGGMAKKQA